MTIDHPTWRELIISAQVFVILSPLHMLGRRLEDDASKEARKLRKRYITKHVKLNHPQKWKRCVKGECGDLAQQVLR